MAAVIVLSDLRDFFRGPLAEVRRKQHLDVRQETERYLLDLLAEGPAVRGPLALALAEAQEAQGPERLAALKQLGDAALYMAGWWLDAVLQGPVDSQYYISMGQRAYGTLAGAASASANRAVFAELAAKFRKLLDVIQELYERLALVGANGTLKLYERYLRTESDRLRWQLQAEGLLAPGNTGRLN